MSDLTLAALDAVAAGGQQTLPAAQPTAQQVARFEAQLQAAGTYEAPSRGSMGFGDSWHSAMGSVGHVAESLRNEFAEAFQTVEPEDLEARGPTTLETVAHKMMEMLDHSTHMSFSAMNLQLLGSAERVTEEAGRTLYQQQG